MRATSDLSSRLEFLRPEDIVLSDLIDTGDKIKRLVGWRDRVLHRLDSTNEGMPPNGTTDADTALLERIERALAKLDRPETLRAANC